MRKKAVPGNSRFTQLVNELALALETRHWTLATAESCTGGWIAKCCTDVAGSSNWFERGFVSYSNDSKRRLLGVSNETLLHRGAVSEEVALEMAVGARRAAGVTAALSVTGIAGPGGGSDEKPVGLVWFGWSFVGRAPWAERVQFDGGRDDIRRQAVGHSLGRLLELLNS
jgi:nicotinamide-nucleotide amidase